MAAQKTHEASSSSSRRWSYDVFLSFRSEDTRKNFIDHLHFALKGAGISAFRDDDELPRGEDFAIELLKAIQGSRISLIVFSTNYGASRWCLDELVEIMDCRRKAQQVVLPIFYRVDPSDVRYQKGSFEVAFARHEKRYMGKDKVPRWRAALTDAANLSGWHFTDGYEGKLVSKITNELLNHLNNTYLNLAIYPVGIDSRVQDMNSLLSVGLNDVRIIGICDMGGLGKTTIAKAIYNQFFHGFEGKSFLANVREIANQPNGQVHLQEQLLLDILKVKNIRVSNVDRGINVIKKRLCNKKVLVVLDNVDQLEQLNALARMRDWFGLGSRIIITTRDAHLLEVIGVDEIFMLKALNDDESFELFSWHAFRNSHPKEDYAELSKDVISYCKGLPLAIEVLGSLLFGRSVNEWESAIAKLKRIPHGEIQKKLRISFDALEDDDVKDIFLDIACFFIGVDNDHVAKILDACGFFAKIGIRVLVDRCLLKINEYNKLTMHDLLRDMGREIVRDESPKEPGNRSRLWSYDDVLNVLKKHTGTKAVEGLFLELPTLNKEHLMTEAFAKMPNLRLLQLNYVHLTGDYYHLPKELRWLCWYGFPSEFIPNSFHVENLVDIDMQYSNLRQVWKEIKFLEKLKVLNLSHSHYLTKTPDFSQLPNLEKIILKDCTSLVEVQQSIGHLHRLVLVDMGDCKLLKILPRSICMLKSLEILNLSGCSKFEKFLEDVDGKSPDFIGIQPASLLGLSSLTTLSLKDCNLSDEGIPTDLGSLSSLQHLDLRSNKFCTLPASINNLLKLESLNLDRCTRLQSLPKLPTSLRTLYAANCTSLERLSNMSRFRNIPELLLTNCYKLVDICVLEKSQSFGIIHMEGCNNLANTFKESLLQIFSVSRKTLWQGTLGDGGLFLPGNEIPNWFSHQCTGPLLSFQVPPILGYKMEGFTVCIVYASDINNISDDVPSITVINKTKDFPHTYSLTSDIPDAPQDHLWVCHLFMKTKVIIEDEDEDEVNPRDRLGFPQEPNNNNNNNKIIVKKRKVEYINWDGGDLVEVVVKFGNGLNVKKCGVHLNYDQAERSTQSDGGELILYNSASTRSAIVVGDDGDVSEDQAGSKAKRGRDDDDEKGPSHGWSDEDQHPKRLRYQAGSAMNIDED